MELKTEATVCMGMGQHLEGAFLGPVSSTGCRSMVSGREIDGRKVRDQKDVGWREQEIRAE